MSTRTTIRRVSYSEILGALNARALISEYAAECSLADHDPQHQMYAAMEECGALQCFGAYVADELIGFASVVNAVMPHNGKRAATMESLFVLASCRDGCAGNDLLSAVEEYASGIGCGPLLYTARIGSRLEKVLSRRSGCLASHTVFTRWLA
jgi:hypothetical protein